MRGTVIQHPFSGYTNGDLPNTRSREFVVEWGELYKVMVWCNTAVSMLSYGAHAGKTGLSLTCNMFIFCYFALLKRIVLPKC